MDPPRDRSEFLIRFVCGALFFGLVTALIGLRFVTSMNVLAVSVWGCLTLGMGFYAALRGDEAWRGLANFFRWW